MCRVSRKPITGGQVGEGILFVILKHVLFIVSREANVDRQVGNSLSKIKACCFIFAGEAIAGGQVGGRVPGGEDSGGRRLLAAPGAALARRGRVGVTVLY